MFHHGDLQSGISLAIQERKFVACFVRDQSNLSVLWEQEWLSESEVDPTFNASVAQMLADKTILLRLDVHSQEANFLNAFCPVTAAPTLIIIHQGQVLDNIAGDVDHSNFVVRVARAVQWDKDDQSAQSLKEHANTHETPSTSTQLSPGTESEPIAPGMSSAPHSDLGSEIAPNASQGPAASSQNPHTIGELFPDRAQRLEAEKTKREAAAKADKTARAEARKREAESALSSSRSKGKQKEIGEVSEKERARRDWVVEQKRRKDEAKRDRERVLAQIESDKLERRAKAQQSRETVATGASEPIKDSVDALHRRRSGAGGTCNLVVRLLDGSSIRGRFEATSTLASQIRDWIKSETGEGDEKATVQDASYTFKHVLTPLPGRSIKISEENQTLQQLDLLPNATLVLVPSEPSSQASASPISILISVWHLMQTVVRYLQILVRAMMSVVVPATRLAPTTPHGPPEDMHDDQVRSGSDNPSTSKAKVVTFADQRTDAEKGASADAEFYNGNSLDFESRPDDDEGEKED